MAESLNAENRAHRANALRRVGVDPERPRTWADQVRGLGLDAEILNLPYWDSRVAGMSQASAMLNPVSGNLYFVAGLSAVSGVDEIAPGG